MPMGHRILNLMKHFTVTIRIQRYMPQHDEKTCYQDFKVLVTKDTTVLDALNMIKDYQDGSLAYRWSCRMAICGSCGMMINRKPMLACQTFIKDLLKNVIVVEPLRNFPVIKDLVVDIDDPMEKMRGVMPYVERMKQKSLEEGEYDQTPEQLAVFKKTSQCIKCMLCYAACPVYGLDRKFIGPAAGALAMRYQDDSRDETKNERLERVIGKDGVWNCSFVGECSVACPKGVDPALALQKLKIAGVIHSTKKILHRL